MILHIPHSHPVIPKQYSYQYLISEDELYEQHKRLNDWYVHELFHHLKANVIDFPFSRLFVDVERYENDQNEPMSAVGMGRFYLKTIEGKKLRYISEIARKSLDYYYNAHHERLSNSTLGRLKVKGKALIVDCHSFPSKPLACDINQDTERPDICLGFDEYHLEEKTLYLVQEYFRLCGFSVGINYPYAGTIVPASFYRKVSEVQSIMIEINRNLYMNEQTLEKKPNFELLKNCINQVLDMLYRRK